MFREILNELFAMIVSHENVKEFKTSGGFDFAKHMTVSKSEEHIFITSPKRFIKELFGYFDESRFKAFKKQFSDIESLGSLDFCEFKNATKIGGSCKRGLLVAFPQPNKKEGVYKVAE